MKITSNFNKYETIFYFWIIFFGSEKEFKRNKKNQQTNENLQGRKPMLIAFSSCIIPEGGKSKMTNSSSMLHAKPGNLHKNSPPSMYEPTPHTMPSTVSYESPQKTYSKGETHYHQITKRVKQPQNQLHTPYDESLDPKQVKDYVLRQQTQQQCSNKSPKKLGNP